MYHDNNQIQENQAEYKFNKFEINKNKWHQYHCFSGIIISIIIVYIIPEKNYPVATHSYSLA